MRWGLVGWLTWAATVVVSGDANAERLVCQEVDADEIVLDGMLDDWQGLRPVVAGGSSADASFDLRCQYHGNQVWLSIDVRDDRVIRGGGAVKPFEDRLVVELGTSRTPLTFWPGAPGVKPRRLRGAGRMPAWITAEDTLQDKGWSAEIAFPIERVGGAVGQPLRLRVNYRDSDRRAGHADELPMERTLELGHAADLLDSFLAAAKLSRSDLRNELRGNVDPTRPGAERVVVAGAVIGVLGEKFAYVALPVVRPDDVRSVELADLRGDGSKLVLVEVRQITDIGTRHLLLGYDGRGGKLTQRLAIEVKKQQGPSQLASKWSLKRRGKGMELHVEAMPAVSWDEDSYGEVAVPGVEPIHVPWDEDRWGGVYWLEGEALRSRVLSGKR